ncbi:MAG: FHA domain-containing protein, partial [Lapillicoccus sp.]
MRIQLTIRRSTAAVPDRDVVVDCGPGTRVAELVQALGAQHLTVAGRRVPDASLVGMPPLLDRVVVRLDGPVEPWVAMSPWEVWVLAGPDAGLRIPLMSGRLLVGRAEDAAVPLTDPLVSRRHAELDVRPATELTVREVGGTNGTWLSGVRLDGSPRALAAGDVVEVGESRLQLRLTSRHSMVVRPDGDGHLLVQGGGAPRPAPPEEVRFPDAPAQQMRMRFPLVALAVPLLLAGVLAAVMRSPTMLLFGLTGPVLSFATWLGERRRRSRTRGDPHQSAALDEAQAALAGALTREREAFERSQPPLAAVMAAAETRSGSLWRDGGAEVRVGVGARASRIVLGGDGAPSMPWHDGVPVTVDLSAVGVLGVCGERGRVVSSSAALLGRLATMAPPSRVELNVVVA